MRWSAIFSGWFWFYFNNLEHMQEGNKSSTNYINIYCALQIVPLLLLDFLLSASGEKCGESRTFPTSAGMFIEFVAKPIPKIMEDSTPMKSATSCSSSSWIFRLPARWKSQKKTVFHLGWGLHLRKLCNVQIIIKYCNCGLSWGQSTFPTFFCLSSVATFMIDKQIGMVFALLQLIMVMTSG